MNPNGTIDWVYSSGRPEYYGPVTIGSDGTIYIASAKPGGEYMDGYVYAFSPNGTLKWKFHTIPNASAPAIAPDGSVVDVGILKVFAINSDGSLKWENGAGTGDSSATIAPDRTIYVGAPGGLLTLNPNGSTKWEYPTYPQQLNAIDSSPALGPNGKIYIQDAPGYLYAVNPDGTLAWKYGSKASGGNYNIYCTAIGADGTIYADRIADPTAPYGTPEVQAINPDGTVKWRYILPTSATSAPAIGPDGTLYVSADDGSLYAFGTPRMDPFSRGGTNLIVSRG